MTKPKEWPPLEVVAAMLSENKAVLANPKDIIVVHFLMDRDRLPLAAALGRLLVYRAVASEAFDGCIVVNFGDDTVVLSDYDAVVLGDDKVWMVNYKDDADDDA